MLEHSDMLCRSRRQHDLAGLPPAVVVEELGRNGTFTLSAHDAGLLRPSRCEDATASIASFDEQLAQAEDRGPAVLRD
jgi:hypothetical protein